MNMPNRHIQYELNIGFMPLTDCAPLVIAKELGIFKRWGLDVNLLRQNSWATLRDKIHAGVLDAGQMLAPMPLASSLGLGCVPEAIMTPMVLSRNGNAVTISDGLWQDIVQAKQTTQVSLPLSASHLKPIIQQRANAGKKLRFATVYTHSCHYYQLRSWFEQSRINISDIDIVILPPKQMVGALTDSIIDGFCVGGPWNAKAVRKAIGLTGVTSSDIWPDFPEKVLGIRAAQYQQTPEPFHLLVKALVASCQWLETIPNRLEAARILSCEQYLDTDLDVVAPSLLGSCLTHYAQPPRHVPMYNQFSTVDRWPGNCPDAGLGDWLINQMLAAGHIDAEQSEQIQLETIYRADIYQRVIDAQEP